MKNRMLILLAISCYTYPVLSQSTSFILDPRDSTLYQTIFIDSLEWMTQNIKLKSTGSYEYAEPCDACGLLYTYEAAQTACPLNFRLPTKQEWIDLFQRLHAAEEKSPYGMFFYGIKDTLMSPSFLNLQYCGYYNPPLNKSNTGRPSNFCNLYGAYWHLDQSGDASKGIHFEYNSSWIGPVEGGDGVGFNVRCLRTVNGK